MSGCEKTSFVRMLDKVDGRLSDGDAAAVDRRMRVADAETLADAAWLDAFAQASRVVLEPPPAGMRAALTERFEERFGARRRTGPLKRLVATLAFDSNLRSADGGVRKVGGVESTRHLVYTSELSDLALSIQSCPGVGGLEIDGQVLPQPGGEGFDFFDVQLLRDGSEYELATADDAGDFAFESVPPGVYEMLLRTDRYEIVVAPVELVA